MHCTKRIVMSARCIPSCSKRLSLDLPSIVHHIILPHHWQPQFYNDVSSSILWMTQFKIWISHDSGKPCRMLQHGMNQPVQNVRPSPTSTTTLSPNKYKLDNMRRDNLKFCNAFFWGFDAQQPPAYKAGLAVRHTIDFSIGTGKSRDWHEIANSLGYEIWNGQFYGLGNKRKAIFDVKLLDWLVPQNSYLYR